MLYVQTMLFKLLAVHRGTHLQQRVPQAPNATITTVDQRRSTCRGEIERARVADQLGAGS